MSVFALSRCSLKIFFLLTIFSLGLTSLSAVAQDSPLPPISLGDRVWFDNDRNGLQDSYDSGLAGIAVNLYDAQEELVARALTDENGNYLFTTAEGVDTPSIRYGVTLTPESDYTLRISLNESELFGYYPTFAYLGSDPALDSNGTLVGAEVVEPVTLGGMEEENLTLDFGFRTGNFGDSVIDLPDEAACPIPGLEEFLVEDPECGGFGGAGPEEPVEPETPVEEVKPETEVELPRGGAGPEEEPVEAQTPVAAPALIRTGGVD